MELKDFDFDLPPELIAQEPVEPRDAARLLVVPRGAGALEHRVFRDLPGILSPGDLLVLNDTRVVPARLFGHRATGGRVEMLLLERAGIRAEVLAKSRRKLQVGEAVPFDGTEMRAVIEQVRGQGHFEIRLEGVPDPEAEILRVGRMPLPPYIRRDREGDPRDERDRQLYQTVYAREAGAIAAPTAGLHFTPEVLAALEDRGIAMAYVTLHVGLGTFQPVRAQRLEDHHMHSEHARLPEATARAIASARARGGRIVAVGTTCVRVLESARRLTGLDRAWEGWTELFLKPGDPIESIDALVTNFHLPQSTLLMLVSAFAGRERILTAYSEAIANHYRFFSYGDACLLW